MPRPPKRSSITCGDTITPVDHALFALLWETGIHLGAANSLDFADDDPDGKQIDLVHRPAQGTQPKNGSDGERPIAISDDLAELFREYATHARQNYR